METNSPMGDEGCIIRWVLHFAVSWSTIPALRELIFHETILFPDKLGNCVESIIFWANS